jgi:hypothetical protein
MNIDKDIKELALVNSLFLGVAAMMCFQNSIIHHGLSFMASKNLFGGTI